MTVNCSPFGPKPQMLLASGQPAVGAQLFFYVAGSVNTKQNSYTNSTGLSANPNPIVLNSLGEPANEIWLTNTAAYKVVYAPAGDTDPPSSPIWTIDNLRGINDVTASIDQWLDSGFVPTYIAGTQFSVPGDQTSVLTVGRRLRTTNSGGTYYSFISLSSFGAGITTVTVVNDSGALDAGLSAISYALLTSTNVSIPNTSIDMSSSIGGQIKFPSTQNASANANTLDDYKEGQWLPTLTFATPGDLSVTYSVQLGRYTKVGNLVTVTCDLDTATFTHTTASGTMFITNLPYTSDTTANTTHSGAGVFSGITKAGYTSFAARLLNNSSVAQIGASGSGVAASNVSAADMPTGGTVQIRFTLTYRTA